MVILGGVFALTITKPIKELLEGVRMQLEISSESTYR